MTNEEIISETRASRSNIWLCFVVATCVMFYVMSTLAQRIERLEATIKQLEIKAQQHETD